MKYLLLFILVFNVYFYFDIVTRYTLSDCLFRFFKKIVKNKLFQEHFRKFHNFIVENFRSPQFKEYLLKLFNTIFIKFKKR